MEYITHQLPNGIRMVYCHDSSYVGHCGLFINTGSRDEMPHESGMAHFIEHTIFKGTSKRKAYHILCRMEDVGGEINAYTTKEQTVVYSSFLKDYFGRALELISDIVFNSVFPEKEVEKEKEVVIDEINSYKDSPSDQIYDDFEELLFPDQPIGKQILGSYESVKNIRSESIKNFIRQNYHTDQMVVSIVGQIPFKKAVGLLEKYFKHIPANLRGEPKRKKPVSAVFHKQVDCNTHQAHCMLGTETITVHDKNKTVLNLLNNVLGGAGLNARLNLSLREKHGIAYNIESNYAGFTDTGHFYVYFGTDPDNIERSLKLIHKEFKYLREKELGSLQLSRAKKQFIGQIAIGAESRESKMLSFGKSILLYNKIDSLENIYERIEAITAKQLREMANQLFVDSQMSRLTFL